MSAPGSGRPGVQVQRCFGDRRIGMTTQDTDNVAVGPGPAESGAGGSGQPHGDQPSSGIGSPRKRLGGREYAVGFHGSLRAIRYEMRSPARAAVS